MSHNTRLSMLSHPAIEHLAHFFVSLVANIFLRGCKKKIVVVVVFFTVSENCDYLVRVLFKTEPNASPVVDFFCWQQVFLLKKNLFFLFSQIIILDPNLE